MSRISELRKRVWSDDATPELVREMTDICRTPNGTMVLRPAQAITLYEAATLGGVYAALRTGGGKTIVSGLLPFVLDAKKPILFVPAKLKQKTRNEFAKLRQHWQIPGASLRIESYEKLGMAKHEGMLTAYEPDLLIFDEAQMLKHVRESARARRVDRHMRYFPFPKTKCCAMTGTSGEIDEFAHIVWWCLREGSPVPKDPDEIQAWAGCLNAKVDDWARTDPADLVPHLGKIAIDYPKAAFRERFIHTPGIVVSVDTYTGAGLVVKPRYVEPSPAVEAAFTDLRKVWEMPDGWSMADASFEVWHAARQLGLGYYYMHDPRPPEPWRDIRKQYCKFARVVLEHSEAYDTEKQVRDGLEGGKLLSPMYEPSPHVPAHLIREFGVGGLNLFDAWQKIQPTYKPEVFPVWLSDTVIDSAIQWGRQGGGIIWVDSVAFGTRLAEKTDWGYFRNFGYDQRKRFIESDRVSGKETIIASIESNKEGRNLQGKWNRNLIVDPPNRGDDWQQLVSRTHRDGQQSRDVYVDYMITCYEYFNSIYNAVNQNESDHEMMSQRYRLLDADVVMPSLFGRMGEFTWTRSDKKNKLIADN